MNRDDEGDDGSKGRGESRAAGEWAAEFVGVTDAEEEGDEEDEPPTVNYYL